MTAATTRTTSSSAPARARGRLPARISFGAATTFVALLTLLHVLKPELDPSWRMISEYALGRYGWLMTAAFGALALSCAALAIALWPLIGTKTGRLGVGLLAMCALGLLLAAACPADPIDAGAAHPTTTGLVHALGATLGGLVPFAAPLVTWALTRVPSPVTGARTRRLLWSAVAIVWLGEILFIGAMATLAPADGRLGPGVHVGWPNRLMILSYCVWLLAVASVIARCGGSSNGFLERPALSPSRRSRRRSPRRGE